MNHQIFEWIIAVAVLVVFISNLVFLWLMYSKVSPLIDKLQQTADRLNPILSEAQGIAGNVKEATAAISPFIAEARPVALDIMTKTNNGINPILNEVQGTLSNVRGITATVSTVITDNQPAVRNIAAKASGIADMTHAQATQVSALVQNDVIPSVRNQVEQLNSLVKRTTDKVDAMATTVETRVIEPMAAKTGDISGMIHDQAAEIRALIQDSALKVRDQIEQLDNLVRRATGGIDSSLTNFETQVNRPAREANYVGMAIKKGISVLFNKDRNQAG